MLKFPQRKTLFKDYTEEKPPIRVVSFLIVSVLIVSFGLFCLFYLFGLFDLLCIFGLFGLFGVFCLFNLFGLFGLFGLFCTKKELKHF